MESTNKNILLGAHTSIAGGLEKALDIGHNLNCSAIQIFTKNQLRWKAPPIGNEKLSVFKDKFFRYHEIKRVVAHSSYLINLASSCNETTEKSLSSVILEIERAINLGIGLYVLHPGFHKGAGISTGIKNLIGHLKGLTREFGDELIICVETMSGQGSAIGSRFEEIAEIVDGVGHKGIGVCFDTCHVFSAGYDIRDHKSYRRTMETFDRLIGVNQIKVIHLNDSKASLASKIDRHEHIGKGNIGLEGFALIMNDSRFQGIPKIIETPKEGNAQKYDSMNLKLLMSLINE